MKNYKNSPIESNRLKVILKIIFAIGLVSLPLSILGTFGIIGIPDQPSTVNLPITIFINQASVWFEFLGTPILSLAGGIAAVLLFKRYDKDKKSILITGFVLFILTICYAATLTIPFLVALSNSTT